MMLSLCAGGVGWATGLAASRLWFLRTACNGVSLETKYAEYGFNISSVTKFYIKIRLDVEVSPSACWMDFNLIYTSCTVPKVWLIPS